MKQTLRFLGRVIFISILLSSAIIKYRTPQKSISTIEKYYKRAQSFTKGYGLSFLPKSYEISDHFHILTKASGIFEAVLAVMLLFGDQLGGKILFVYILVLGLLQYSELIISGAVFELKTKNIAFFKFLAILGISAALANQHYIRKKPLDIK